MHTIVKLFVGAATLAAVAAMAYAQGQGQGQDARKSAPTMAEVGISDPPGPMPDPSHIPFLPPDKIKWEGDPKGEQHVVLFGDPTKPGLYGELIKWNPGNASHPHRHDHDRFIYVISGTWWVSSSNHYDAKLTYPVPAGSYVKDVANTVHWDGARAGGPPAVLELVGMGPVKTVQVDENGKPLPPR